MVQKKEEKKLGAMPPPIPNSFEEPGMHCRRRKKSLMVLNLSRLSRRDQMPMGLYLKKLRRYHGECCA